MQINKYITRIAILLILSTIPVQAENEIIIGNGATAINRGIAIGTNAKAHSLDAIAIGDEAKASRKEAIAIGRHARAEKLFSTALGLGAQATGHQATALGSFSHAYGNYSTAIGGSEARADYSFTVGKKAIADNSANGAVAIGSRVTAEAKNAFVLGSGYFLQGGNVEHEFINNKENSMAVGFNSDRATLFVGGSQGKGTTGNVGIGTDAPTAKLDVAGDLKAANVSTSIVNASFGVKTQSLEASTAKIKDIKAGIVSSENVNASAITTDLLHVKEFANINSYKAQSGSVDNLTANQITADTINSRLAYIKNIASDLIEGKEVNVDKVVSRDLTANKAGISELNAKQAKIKDLTIFHSETNESFNENLFVGTRKDFKVESTALVAYEKVDLAEVKDTSEITDLKAEIEKYQKAAERYYSVAERYARYSWASRYKDRADKFAQHAQSLKYKLLALVAEQGDGTKKVARVGVGVAEPQQTLHISGAMRLEPLASAPKAAGSGDMYVDKTGALCVFLNDHWNYVTGDGQCTEISIY